MENYIKIYEEHYGIQIPDEYVIHHMDRDRSNNKISNLLLLPEKLHQQYHFYSQGSGNDGFTFGTELSDMFRYDYNHVTAERLLEVLKQCEFWCFVKERMEYDKTMLGTLTTSLQGYVSFAKTRFGKLSVPEGINKGY